MSVSCAFDWLIEVSRSSSGEDKSRSFEVGIQVLVFLSFAQPVYTILGAVRDIITCL